MKKMITLVLVSATFLTAAVACDQKDSEQEDTSAVTVSADTEKDSAFDTAVDTVEETLAETFTETLAETTAETASTPDPLINFTWAEGELIRTGIMGWYPRLYTLQDGTLLMGFDNNGIGVVRSTDGGLTWSKAVIGSCDYPGAANAAFFQDEDGVIYLGFRSTGNNQDGSFFANIHVTVSRDNGYTWEKHSTVYENVEPAGVFKGVWEPHFGMMNGKLTCFYANDSTSVVTDYQNIEYKQWDAEIGEWSNRTIVCDGAKHLSRDGMPVWQQLSTGEYVCVIEAFNKRDNDQFAIKLTWSEDGVNWSKPVTVMNAKVKGTRCAAPYIIELPTGQLLISCQTNEQGGGTVMATVLSDGTSVRDITYANFGEHDYPNFGLDASANTEWNSLAIHNGYIYAATIASDLELKLVRYCMPAEPSLSEMLKNEN